MNDMLRKYNCPRCDSNNMTWHVDGTPYYVCHMCSTVFKEGAGDRLGRIMKQWPVRRTERLYREW